MQLIILLCAFESISAWVVLPVLPRIVRSYNAQTTSLLKSTEEKVLFASIPIVYESERLLVINKPPGIAHHDDDMGTPGIVTRIREQLGVRVWGVHRLDRVTSGILVMAKDAELAKDLTCAFAAGDISKVYFGISAKRPTKKKQGWVQGGMVRSRDKSWKLTRDSHNYAKTRFFTAPIRSKDDDALTLLLFRPFTGKTHQLRVAAKSMGMPLLGDPIYKDGSATSSETTPMADRTYLHASGILLPPLPGNNPDPLAFWCSPPFYSIISHDSDAVHDLMEKQCDVPEILEAMERTRREVKE